MDYITENEPWPSMLKWFDVTWNTFNLLNEIDNDKQTDPAIL